MGGEDLYCKYSCSRIIGCLFYVENVLKMQYIYEYINNRNNHVPSRRATVLDLLTQGKKNINKGTTSMDCDIQEKIILYDKALLILEWNKEEFLT